MTLLDLRGLWEWECAPPLLRDPLPPPLQPGSAARALPWPREGLLLAPALEGGGRGRAGKGRARQRKRARAPVSSSRLPPAGSPRLRNPAGTRTQRSHRQPRSGAAAPPPGTGSGFPPLPPPGLPSPSPPAQAGKQPERSGLACPPPPSHPPRPEAPPPPSHPDAHGGARHRGATAAGTAASPKPAAQPRRRPRPGLRGAEPRRGREDGGREAGAQRSPAPPPPPAAGENCACRLREARAPPPAAGARLRPRFLPSPPPAFGVLPSTLVCSHPVACSVVASGPRWAPTAPRGSLPAVRPRPQRASSSRLGYPAQRGLRASRSGGSLPGSEWRRPPPLGRAQPQLPPAAAAAPPPGEAAALGRRLLLLWRRRLLPAAPRGEKHKAQRPPPAGSPPAAGPGLSSHTPRRRCSLSRRSGEEEGEGRRRSGRGGGRSGAASASFPVERTPTPGERAPARPPRRLRSLPQPARAGSAGGSWEEGRELGEPGRPRRREGRRGGGWWWWCWRRRRLLLLLLPPPGKEGGGRGRETRSRPDGGGARSLGGRAGAENDLVRLAGELAGFAGEGGRAEARPRRGCPEGPPASGEARGAPTALFRSSSPSPPSSD
nr:basic salivary proline-rich protein 2-like [Gorilla gorilla gorilla]